MGFDCDRFKSDVEDEFKCAICCDVIEDPLQVLHCEHVFCRECITQWIQKEGSCPVDRNAITGANLAEPSRLFRNLHSRLELKCEFSERGCDAFVKIEEITIHTTNCKYNPNSAKECVNKCGALITPAEEAQHDCLNYLKGLIDLKDMRIKYLENRCEEQENLARDLQALLDNQIEENSRLISQIYVSKEQTQDVTIKEVSEQHKQLIKSLKDKRIIKSERVEKVLLSVDRKLFCATDPYVDYPQPIGFGATISSPAMHAYVLELLREKLVEGAKALDIGAGSGLLSVCMALMVGNTGRVIGIDNMPQIVQNSIERVQKNFNHLCKGQRIRFIIADGRQGFPKGSPYDVIHVGAAINQMVSRFLVKQLKKGGRLVAPIIDQRNGDIILEVIEKITDDTTTREKHHKVIIEELSSNAKQSPK